MSSPVYHSGPWVKIITFNHYHWHFSTGNYSLNPKSPYSQTINTMISGNSGSAYRDIYTEQVWYPYFWASSTSDFSSQTDRVNTTIYGFVSPNSSYRTDHWELPVNLVPNAGSYTLVQHF